MSLTSETLSNGVLPIEKMINMITKRSYYKKVGKERCLLLSFSPSGVKRCNNRIAFRWTNSSLIKYSKIRQHIFLSETTFLFLHWLSYRFWKVKLFSGIFQEGWSRDILLALTFRLSGFLGLLFPFWGSIYLCTRNNSWHRHDFNIIKLWTKKTLCNNNTSHGKLKQMFQA